MRLDGLTSQAWRTANTGYTLRTQQSVKVRLVLRAELANQLIYMEGGLQTREEIACGHRSQCGSPLVTISNFMVRKTCAFTN